MSKRSYINGFCKVAAAHGLDPENLARYALSKSAADDKSDFWQSIKAMTGNAINWYNDQNEGVKALIGGGLGSAAGIGLGSALFGKNGVRSGAVLGALLGAGGSVDWSKVSKKIDALVQESKRVAAEEAKKNAGKPPAPPQV